MSRREISAACSSWLYALALACVFLFVKGYAFNTADQAEHLPQVYQTLDPELYAGDYFVPHATAQFTVRHYYEQLALALARTIGLEWGAFLLTLLCIMVMAWAFHQMAWTMFRNRWAAWAAPVMVLLVFYGFTVGGNHIIYGTLISSTLAKSLASVALLQFLRRKHLAAGLLLGIASLIQVLVGLQLMLILSVVLPFVLRDHRMRSMAALWVAYLISALFILVPTFQQQFAAQGDFDEKLYYEVLYRFRNYRHYLPSLFPITQYIKFFGLLALGWLSYRFARPDDRGMYPALVAAVLFGMMVYTVGMEVFDLHFLGKLQWFKTSLWAAAFSAMMVAGVIGMLLQSIFPVERISFKVSGILSGAVAVFLLVLMTNSIWLPESIAHRYMVGNRPVSNLERMHNWIAENTPKDAMILVSPENTAFACQAKRPMPVHFHAIIHTPQFMLPWYGKVQDIYGVGLDDIGTENARQLVTERYAQRNYTGNSHPIRYRMDNVETCTFLKALGPVTHREGRWILSEFRPQ
jgi:hypothetical protein